MCQTIGSRLHTLTLAQMRDGCRLFLKCLGQFDEKIITTDLIGVEPAVERSDKHGTVSGLKHGLVPFCWPTLHPPCHVSPGPRALEIPLPSSTSAPGATIGLYPDLCPCQSTKPFLTPATALETGHSEQHTCNPLSTQVLEQGVCQDRTPMCRYGSRDRTSEACNLLILLTNIGGTPNAFPSRIMTHHPEAFYSPSYSEQQAEIEDSQRCALFARIVAMRRAMWTSAEIEAAIAQWPTDWQRLVA